MKKKERSFTGWEALFVLLVLLFVKGAYMAQQLVPIAIGVSVVVMCMIIYGALTKSKVLTVNWLTLGCLFVAVSYAWTLWTTLSVEQSLLKMLEWSTYGLLLLFIPVGFAKNARKLLLVFSGLFVVVHIAMVIGLVNLQDGMLYLPNGLSLSGVRLNGVLQYANATGAIAGSLWLYSLYSYLTEKSWTYVDIAVMTGLAFILWLTESRGALLVVGLGFLVGLYVMEQQLRYFMLFVATALVSLLAYVIVAVMHVSIISVVIAILVITCFTVLAEKYKGVWHWTKAKWVLPSGVVGVGIVAVMMLQLPFIPQAWQSRFSLATFVDRFVYMQDAWQAIKQFWLLGAGGEAWQFAMFEHQSAPYIANDIHMFYEQHWLETGVLGIAVLFVLVGVALWQVAKRNKMLLPAILVLLGHACFDFTLSYSLGIILLLLFLYEALGEHAIYSPKGLNIVIIVIAIIVGSGAIFWQQGENAFAAYEATGQSEKLTRAIEKNPFATRYYEVLAQEGSPLEAYEKIVQYEPQHARIHFYMAQAYEQSDVEKALQHYALALTYDRFDRLKYELAAQALLQIGTADALKLQRQFNEQLQQMEILANKQGMQDQRQFMQ